MDGAPGDAITPWTVRASREIVRDQWIGLRADECVTADGHVVAPYYVLDFPDWVLVVAIDTNDQIVLVEQYRHGLGIVSLEVPCGCIDAADADPLAAGRRELLEETGFGGGDWRWLTALSPNPSNHANRCHVVLADRVAPQAIPHADPAERLRLVQMPVAEAVRRALAGEVMQAMHVAALAIALGTTGRWTG